MSMLSEPKQKRKNFLNPRNTQWSKDENKLGQKILEKMGWSKGKGLGKFEQGEAEPLNVKANSDQKGVGYKKNGEEWVTHYDNFEAVLASLNSDDTNTEKVDEHKISDSLVERSKNSKSRLHYKKFTQGKDTSSYKEEDLACILGSKKTAKMLEVSKQKDASVDKENGIGDSLGMNTVYGGSIKEYFKQKMEKLQKARSEGILGDFLCKNTEENCDSLSNTLPDIEFEPEKSTFSFDLSVAAENEPEDVKRKVEDVYDDKSIIKKKSKKNKKAQVENDIEVEDNLAESNKYGMNKKGKIKLLKTFRQGKIEEGECKKRQKGEKNEEFDDVHNVEPSILRTENEDTKVKKKKKKSKREESTNNFDHNLCEVSVKKNKRKLEILSQKDNFFSKKVKNVVEATLCNDDLVSSQENTAFKMSQSETPAMNRSNIEYSDPENTEPVEKSKNLKDGDSCKLLRKNSKQDLNESYLTATSPKKMKTDEISSDSEPYKKLKKLKRYASEMTVTKSFQLSKNNLEDVESIDSTNYTEGSQDLCSKSKKAKISSKRSFKDLTADIGEKFKQKVKTKKNSVVSKDENIVNLKFPIKSMHKFKKCASLQCDLNKVFPGSNLGSIKGYDRD